jgi:hypothetical protein
VVRRNKPRFGCESRRRGVVLGEVCAEEEAAWHHTRAVVGLKNERVCEMIPELCNEKKGELIRRRVRRLRPHHHRSFVVAGVCV